MKTLITFEGNLPGNNGTYGLLRMKPEDRTALRNKLQYEAMSCSRNRHPGCVSVVLTRYSTGEEMDKQNLVSTGKIPFDALVRAGIITDDKPAIIVKENYVQVKVKKVNQQKTTIEIEDAEPVFQLPSYPLAIARRIDFVVPVEWDRFTEFEGFFVVYGWIKRSDGQRDFVLFQVQEGHPDSFFYTTSSAKYSRTIMRAMYGTEEGHNDCRKFDELYFNEDNDDRAIQEDTGTAHGQHDGQAGPGMA